MNIVNQNTDVGKHRTADDNRPSMEPLAPEAIMKAIIEAMTLSWSRKLVQRIVVLILLLGSVPAARISELTGASISSIYEWKARLNSVTSIDKVHTFFHYRPDGHREKKGKLLSFADQIKEMLDTENFFSRQQIADRIHEKWGIRVSLSSISHFLKKHGYRKLKCGSLPIHANVVKQREFYDAILKPLMDKAKAQEIKLFFADAAHFVMGCDFVGSIWSKIRRFQKTLSGRKRYNVLGAIDFIDKNVLTVTNGKDAKNEYITASEVITLLDKVAEAAGKMPAFLVLDNAKYQKCDIITKHAAALGITLVYIPPYSPNLNLIERFWKFTKAALRTKYFTDYDEFCRRIDEIIASSTGSNKEKIDSLIGEKVQLFDDFVQVVDITYKKLEAKTAAA